MPELAKLPFLVLRCDTTMGNIHLQSDIALHANWTTLFGPSGSGKSSLLRAIAGLLRPGVSEVTLHGRELAGTPTHLREIGFVSQSTNLFPHLSVLENITFSRYSPSENREPTRNALDHVLESFQLRPLLHASTATLSGGEAQRVALARALFPMPRLLLLDESFSGLDRETRTRLVETIRGIQAERKIDRPMPVLAVTHDVAEIFATADEVVRMQGGSILSQGPPALVLCAERAALLQQLQHPPSTRATI